MWSGKKEVPTRGEGLGFSSGMRLTLKSPTRHVRVIKERLKCVFGPTPFV